jgi:hypothetical protein
MSRGKSYTIHGRVFPTQKALEEEVRTRLELQSLNEQFYDSFLAAVLNTLHGGVKMTRERASGWFERLDWETQLARGTPSAEIRGGGEVIVAQFYPSGKWCDITLRPWRNNHWRYSDVVEYLTGKSSPPPETGRGWKAEVIG